MDDLQELQRRQGELESERRWHEPRWRELARILRPDEQDFEANEGRQDERLDTYDSTPLYAHEDFVNGLFSEAMNPADRWFEYELPDRELMKFRPVKDWLWNAAAATYNSLDPQVSSFYTEAPAALADTAAFGPGCIYQEDMPGLGVVDRAVPVGRTFVGRDAGGGIDTVHHRMKLTGRQMKQCWRNVPANAQDATSYTVLHCVRPNRNDYDPQKLGPAGQRFASTFFSTELRDEWRVDGGYHELPYHFFEWSRRAGRAYARGPGHNALADMGMLDEQQRSVMTALQFEAEPILLTHDESIMTAADIAPHAVIAGGMSDNGKPLVQRLDRGENLHLPMAAAEATRNAIREAFKFSLMQLINRPQMTATEFAGWKEEKLRSLAPHLVHLQVGLSSFLQRRFWLLWRAKRLPPPPPELAGQALKITFVSAFAKAQKLGRARGAMQYAGGLMQVAQFDPEVMDNLDGDSYARVVHEGFSNEPTLIRDPRDVAQRRQARAQAQAQQVKVEQAAQMAGVYADVAHAKQADTLAGARGGKPA